MVLKIGWTVLIPWDGRVVKPVLKSTCVKRPLLHDFSLTWFFTHPLSLSTYKVSYRSPLETQNRVFLSYLSSWYLVLYLTTNLKLETIILENIGVFSTNIHFWGVCNKMLNIMVIFSGANWPSIFIFITYLRRHRSPPKFNRSFFYHPGPLHKMSLQSIHNVLLDGALEERRPPWPRQIITHTWDSINQVCSSMERCINEGMSLVKGQLQSFWIITCTSFWTCCNYYGVVLLFYASRPIRPRSPPKFNQFFLLLLQTQP